MRKEVDEMELRGKFFMEGNIKVITGLHIGGQRETLDIGGVDNPMIRDKRGVYIPGSSLKGKIRSLLEGKYGTRIFNISKEDFESDINNGNISDDLRKIFKKYKHELSDSARVSVMEGNIRVIKDGDREYRITKSESEDLLGISDKKGDPCKCGNCSICKIFGPHSDNVIEPARVIVRDSYLVEEEKIEIKSENTINRVSGKASNPRSTERVTSGSLFKFEIVFNIYKEGDKELIKRFIEGMKLLEDDYLGGSGSRGYGKVKFEKMSLFYKPKEYYEGDKDKKMEKRDIPDIADLETKLNEFEFS